jgi:hypothetical protein
MPNNAQILEVLRREGVPFVVIGAHAVNFHGYGRATEDTDIVWKRSPESEQGLFRALSEIESSYIGNDIDPATGIERTYPITHPHVQANHLMMLITRFGFLDLFDYIPGLPQEDVGRLLASSIESGGVRYASLEWLRRMKLASGRAKDKLDLENLPE